MKNSIAQRLSEILQSNRIYSAEMMSAKLLQPIRYYTILSYFSIKK